MARKDKVRHMVQTITIENPQAPEQQDIVGSPDFWEHVLAQFGESDPTDAARIERGRLLDALLEKPGEAMIAEFVRLYTDYYQGRVQVGAGGSTIEFATRDTSSPQSAWKKHIDGLYTIDTLSGGEYRYRHTLDRADYGTFHRNTFIVSSDGELVVLAEGAIDDGLEVYEVTDDTEKREALEAFFKTTLDAAAKVRVRGGDDRAGADSDAVERLQRMRTSHEPYLEHLELTV